jgi:hypothetical protein
MTKEISFAKRPDNTVELSWWKWMLIGALYGVAMRLLFGILPRNVTGVMSVAFLLATPFAVGALTVYGFRNVPQSVMQLIFRPWATVALMLAGCAISMLEGAICLAMMAPLFLVCGSVGGIAMGIALKYTGPHGGKLPAVALLPFLMMLGEHGVPLENRELELTQSIVVNAPPHTVWTEILTARDIQADELPLSLTHLIGVPKPVEGINVAAPGGEVRYSKWERGVNFRAAVTSKEQDRSITWHYVFDDKSFPAGSMDEHVAIGGEYFALHDTTFNLAPLPGGRTRLDIVTHHRISTGINFYAIPAATLLGNDFIATILTLYKNRSERHAMLVTDAAAQHIYTIK